MSKRAKQTTLSALWNQPLELSAENTFACYYWRCIIFICPTVLKLPKSLIDVGSERKKKNTSAIQVYICMLLLPVYLGSYLFAPPLLNTFIRAWQTIKFIRLHFIARWVQLHGIWSPDYQHSWRKVGAYCFTKTEGYKTTNQNTPINIYQEGLVYYKSAYTTANSI